MDNLDSVKASTVEELKKALQEAINERREADVKIETIRKEIASYVKESQGLLKDIQNLSDSAGNITSTTIKAQVGDYLTIDFVAIFKWVVKYILPFILLFLIIWGAVRIVKDKAKLSYLYNETGGVELVESVDPGPFENWVG